MSILRRSSTASKRDKIDVARGVFWLFVFAVCLVLFAVLSICFGAAPVCLSDLWRVLTGAADSQSAVYRIIMYVRLPRTAAAMLAGSALAVSGAIIQAVLNNVLASPNIIGVNAGAGFFTLLCMVLWTDAPYLLPVAAFSGALATALFVWTVAMKTGASRITIILTGIAVSSILSAGINAITILHPDAVIGAVSFMMGGLSTVTISGIRFASGYIGVGLMLALSLSYEMNVLNLGEDTALSLGMHVKLYRFVLIAAAAVLAGAAVSFAGLLGFVGLIVPHGVRMLTGNDNRYVVPGCALSGAAFVTACDLLARRLFAPYELPVGIIMSVLGGPFFIYLLLRERRRIHD